MIIHAKMLEADATIVEELLLHDEDFPGNYQNMAHPDDYHEIQSFEPQFIYHSYHGRHDRLIARIPWKVSDDMFVPMSFVCDTGAPSHLYLSTKAFKVLEDYKLILTDDRGNQYVKIHSDDKHTFNANVEETPKVHKNANIIGLKALVRLHLVLKDNQSFGFNGNFAYL